MGVLCCKPEPVDFDGPVDLYHFYLLRAVGKGAFGKVRVVQHKQTKVSLRPSPQSQRAPLPRRRARAQAAELTEPLLDRCVWQNLYALKYINKAKCIRMRAVSNIIQERRLLEEIESPFVCNLRVSDLHAGNAVVDLVRAERSHPPFSPNPCRCELKPNRTVRVPR